LSLVLRQLRFRVFAPAMVSSVNELVRHVFGVANPLEVIGPVVRSASVEMRGLAVQDVSFVTIERQRDETMHRPRPALAFFCEHDGGIAA